MDVQYDEARKAGLAAAIVFDRWADPAPLREYTALTTGIQDYVPGEFFRRELPCLLAVLARVEEPLDMLIIDGYVQLGDRPGLGRHLFDRLGGKLPVVGVAKTPFHGAQAIEVFRGVSRSPLYVTAIGVAEDEAAREVRQMHGPHRVPTLLKRVDQLARATTPRKCGRGEEDGGIR